MSEGILEETPKSGLRARAEISNKSLSINTKRELWLGDRVDKYTYPPIKMFHGMETTFDGRLLDGEVQVNRVSADARGTIALLWIDEMDGLSDWKSVVSYRPKSITEINESSIQQLAIYVHLRQSNFPSPEEMIASIASSALESKAAHEDRHFCDQQGGFSEKELRDNTIFLAQEIRARAVGWLVEKVPVAGMLWDMADINESLLVGYNEALALRKRQPDISRASLFGFAGGLCAVRKIVLDTLMTDLADTPHLSLQRKLTATLKARRLRLTKNQLTKISKEDAVDFLNLIMDKPKAVLFVQNLIQKLATISDERIKRMSMRDVVA